MFFGFFSTINYLRLVRVPISVIIHLICSHWLKGNNIKSDKNKFGKVNFHIAIMRILSRIFMYIKVLC